MTTTTFKNIEDDLEKRGFSITNFNLPSLISELVDQKNFQKIDEEFFKLTNCDGDIFKFLKNFCNVKSMEFIISLRESRNEWEEDGIWHDDGSRILAFSLSLTKIRPQGGILEIRKKGESESHQIPTPNFGEMIIFKTGVDNFEHKINRVTDGSRLIIAGWCS